MKDRKELVEIIRTFVEDRFEPIPCEECGEDSKHKVTYLLEGYRNNRASKAYGKDDCSWCADDHRHACHAHVQLAERTPPDGYVTCSTFTGERFAHMLRQKIKPDITAAKAAIAEYDSAPGTSIFDEEPANAE